MEYLLVDHDGRILAAAPSVAQVALELARIERDPDADRAPRVVRHEEYGGDVAGASAFVTVTPLPSLLGRSRSR